MSRDHDDEAAPDGGRTWRRPTRRAFVAMIGAAATALAAGQRGLVDRAAQVVSTADDSDRPRSTWSGKTRWIGHC